MATPRRPRSLPAPRPNPLRDLVTQKTRATDAARERRRVQELKNDLPSIIQERVGEQIQKLETRLITEVQELGQRAMEESTNALTEQLSGRIETLEKVSALQTQTLASLRDSSEEADRKVSAIVNQIEQNLAAVVPGFELEPSKHAPIAPPASLNVPVLPGYEAPAPPDQRPPDHRPLALRPRVDMKALAGSLIALDDSLTLGDTMLSKMPAMPVGGRLNFLAIAPAAAGGVHPQFLPEAPVEMVKADPVDISEIVGKNGFCPNCTSTDVRRAMRRGMFEEFLRLFAIAPFRCRACRHKFYRF